MIVLFISAIPLLVKNQDKTLQRTSCSPFVFDCRTGGIIPTVAQRLHRENIGRVVQEAMERSGVTQSQLSAVATTVKPGLALSLGIGLHFSLNFVKLHQKPFIPIHHMEAHALMVRMLQPLVFPFPVLLVSGHSPGSGPRNQQLSSTGSNTGWRSMGHYRQGHESTFKKTLVRGRWVFLALNL